MPPSYQYAVTSSPFQQRRLSPGIPRYELQQVNDNAGGPKSIPTPAATATSGGFVQPNQITYIIPAPSASTTQVAIIGFPMKFRKATTVLGALQIFLGIVTFAFNLASNLVVFGNFGFWSGLWCGAVFIIAGALAVAAARKQSKACLVAAMVFSILAAVIFVHVSVALLSIETENWFTVTYAFSNSQISRAVAGVAYGLTVVALIACIVEFFIAIIQAGFTCADCCPGCRKTNYAYFLKKQEEQKATNQPRLIYTEPPPN